MTNFKKIYFWAWLSPVVIAFILALIILIFFKHLPPKLPLFYSLSWGEKELVSSNQFLIIPATIILMALVNLILSWQLHSSQSFFKKILLINSCILSLILTITVIKIILIFI